MDGPNGESLEADRIRTNSLPLSQNIAEPGSASLTWVPPGHYYSPIVDPDQIHVRAILDVFGSSELIPNDGLCLNNELLLDTLMRLGRHHHKLSLPVTKIAGVRYFCENPLFSYGDAAVLSCFLLEFRPNKVIEVGSGYSSCLLMDINDQFFGGAIDLRFIEPYPDSLFRLVRRSDRYLRKLCKEPLQTTPRVWFEDLRENDILFIDSSHISKMGSDVNHYLFNILPYLKAGVLVHIHDIPYPFEYPPQWIRDENRSWNEAYAVHAFLQFNSAYEIIYFNHYMYRRFSKELSIHLPIALKNPGASLWLRRTS